MNPWLCNLLFNNSGGSSLPATGQTFYASLKTSLVPEVGTGGPTWSRATAAWRFNDIGLLRQIPSGCAEFGGARLVRNTAPTNSQDFSNAAWTKGNVTVTGTNTIVCSNATNLQRIYRSGTADLLTAGTKFCYAYRVQKVVGGVGFVQITGNTAAFGSVAYCNFSLDDGSFNAVGCTAVATQVSTGVYDICATFTATATGTSLEYASLCLVDSLDASRIASFTGDGIKSFELLRAWSVDVTGRDASYVPEYVSVGVLSAPYHGAGVDGSKYFTTDWQGAPLPVASLTRLRQESSATNALLWSRDLTAQAISMALKRWSISETSGAEITQNGSFDSDLANWTAVAGTGGSISATGGVCTITSDGNSAYTGITNSALLTVGNTYVVSITASGTGSIKFQSNKEVTGIGNGVNIFSFVANGTAITLARTPGVSCNLAIDSISVKLASVQCSKTATGLDGTANSASTLTATSADAIILQPITLASAARCTSTYVRRKTGTGTISFTQDGGSTWTNITSQLNSATYSRVQITATLANPSVGFKISTSGDAIEVDCVQNEAGSVATSPIVTTTTTVNRNADSLTYQTASNWADAAGTAYLLASPVTYSGGAIGSATNGLLLSASNSGATAYDGTNSANGPAGTPGTTEKLALAWGSSAMSVSSSGAVGTAGTYDGAMGLSSIGVGVGASGYFGDVAIYDYKMTDAELQAITT